MSELFREIEEDIKRERLDKLWQSVGRFAVWGSVVIIATTAIFVVWGNYTESQDGMRTSVLLSGVGKIDAADYKSALPDLSRLTEDDSSAIYPIAMLQKARAQELSGDVEGAKKTYHILSSQKNEYGELARLKVGGDDSGSQQVFRLSFLEKKAWEALAKGNKEEAGKLFTELANDKNSPRSVAQRATEVARFIAPEKSTETKVVK